MGQTHTRSQTRKLTMSNRPFRLRNQRRPVMMISYQTLPPSIAIQILQRCSSMRQLTNAAVNSFSCLILPHYEDLFISCCKRPEVVVFIGESELAIIKVLLRKLFFKKRNRIQYHALRMKIIKKFWARMRRERCNLLLELFKRVE